jgi:hypothetical protein
MADGDVPAAPDRRRPAALEQDLPWRQPDNAAWAISPDSIIARSVSSMPFLVAIQSPNRTIQRRSAAGGGKLGE